MNSGLRLGAHWALLHLLLAGLLFHLLRPQGLWFLLAEATLILSFVLGIRGFSRGRLPQKLARLGSELIREQDFTAKFRTTGRSEVDQLIALFNQMSERLREERLLSSERNFFLERLLEAAPVAIVILDHEGGIAQLNPAASRLLELDEPSIVGRPLAQIDASVARASDEPRPHDGWLGDALEGLEAPGARLLNYRGRKVKASAGHFFDRGFPRRFFVIEELTQELMESERTAYGRLIRTISHEVGNSVGAVSSLLGSCSDMAEPLVEEDRRALRASLRTADTRLRGLSSFINGFAEVVRLPTPDRRPCDLIALLDDILILLGPDLANHSIQVEWRSRPGPVEVSADKNQLEQLLVNVFRNAIEAISDQEEPSDGGTLTLEVRTSPALTLFRLLDDGRGIAPAIRDQLFVPFSSTKRSGRGLGLVLVREIAAKHGWDVTLDTVSDGSRHQTAFRLEMPNTQEPRYA